MDSATQKTLDQIDKKLGKLLADLDQYTDDVLNQKPAPDVWSVLQVMEHLYRAESISLAYVKKKLSFKPKLKRAGLATAWRSFVLRLYLNLPIKWKAPKAVSEETFPAQSELEELGERWQKTRQETRDFFESLPNDIWDKEVYKHPFAGRLKLHDMLTFYDAHFSRHQKQIYRTLEKVKAQA